jgi:hypothetical protein
MTKKNLSWRLLAFAIFTLFTLKGIGQEMKVTITSLLSEMTDRTKLAQFPYPEYTCKQFSSYNKSSKKPGDFTWFANLDNNYFIRTEINNGRREFVLFDAEGPGAVVRLWTTFSRYDRKGIFRFYFDNETKPGIEGEPMDLISGGKLVGSPLSFSVSEETDYNRRGHNLYLPIPYSHHLKITYETNGIVKARDGNNETNEKGEMFYYHIDYRTYKSGTEVKTFEINDLTKYSKNIKETLEKLEKRDRGINDLQLKTETFSGKLVPGRQKRISIEGSNQAIRKIQIKINAANFEQSLRSTVISASFDGKQTIWAPVGDFFGAGYKIIPTSTWYQEVKSDGTIEVFWVMPFKSKCLFTIINYGEQDVEIVDGKIFTSSWKWDERSMYFGSSWYQNTRINTGLVKERDGKGDMFDVKYTTLNGQGVYVGDGVTLFNCSPAWWGEGDEKIFVDNEAFPSHFGTGTEDYYGYAWCRPEKFIHPFIAQPDGSGNLNIGYTSNLRYRSLDAIPFKNHLQFDMELWHWGYTTMNHAPVTYWYIRPDGNCEIKPDIAGVKEPVVTKREQIFPPIINNQQMVEGEDLVLVKLTGTGIARVRPIQVPEKPNWTKAMMAWTGAKQGEEVTFKFICQKPGDYNIALNTLMISDMTKMQFLLNNKVVESSYKSSSTTSREKLVTLTGTKLNAGDNLLTIKIAGKEPIEDQNIGIDNLLFIRL